MRGGIIRKQSHYNTKICSFPGAGVEKVADHTEVELKYKTPEIAILYAGGNDLANKIEIETIVDNLAYLGLEMKDRGVKKIAISGMCPRKDLMHLIPALNKELKGMCRHYGYDFISNSNFSYEYDLCYDKVHLNYDGVAILENNFIKYLRGLSLGNEEE